MVAWTRVAAGEVGRNGQNLKPESTASVQGCEIKRCVILYHIIYHHNYFLSSFLDHKALKNKYESLLYLEHLEMPEIHYQVEKCQSV